MALKPPETYPIVGPLNNARIKAVLFVIIVVYFWFSGLVPLSYAELATPPVDVSVYEANPHVFIPGSLNMSKVETLRRCHIDKNVYSRHMRRRMCTYSKELDLFYILIPKSGSSTGRKAFQNYFNSTEFQKLPCSKYLFFGQDVLGGATEKSLRVASLRNPYQRYFSSFDEMLYRRLTESWKSVPSELGFLRERFQHTIYKDFAVWVKSKEGSEEMTRLFEQFVAHYNYRKPFDVHLTLQAASFTYKNLDGETVPFHRMMDTSHLTRDLRKLAKDFGVQVSIPDKTSRKRNRFINVKDISHSTILKICQQALLDFCCLNYKMPPECLLDSIQPGFRPRCAWIKHNGEDVIKPILF